MSFCIYSDTMQVMNVFQSTEEFDKWVRNLKDRVAKAAIELARGLARGD